MRVQKLEVGSLGTNCYLAWDEASGEGIVIDPGDAGGYISEEIMREKIELKAIFLTHAHFDHVQAVLEVKLNFRVPIIMHKADEKIYENSQKSMEYWTKQKGAPVPKIDRYIKEGDKIEFGDEKLMVMETPGHTPGSVCLYSKKHGVLFSGDTLFRAAIGRTDFSYSDPQKMQESLKKLSKLPGETRVLPGHGEETEIGEEN